MRAKKVFARALLALLCLCAAPAPVGAAEEIQLLLTTDSGEETPARGVDIFCHDDLDDQVIHPGSGGTFRFTITNPEAFDVDYRLSITETNLHGVPIEYSLQSGGKTVEEDGDIWLSAEELADHEERLAANAGREMALHWRWRFTVDDEGDARDTSLGGSSEATASGAYTMLMTVYAEQSEQTATPGPKGKAGGHNAKPFSPADGRATAPANHTAANGPSNTGGIGAEVSSPAQTGDGQAAAPALLLGGLAGILAIAALRRQETRKPWQKPY